METSQVSDYNLAKRFDVLGCGDSVNQSPIRQGSLELARNNFKERLHHSEEQLFHSWDMLCKIRYYAEHYATYCSSEVESETKRWAEYDSSYWREYARLVERDLNESIPDPIHHRDDEGDLLDKE
jgi:hypothetical protein